MASSDPIIFYDIPTKDKDCWSLNLWKGRFLLNYKGVDYKTEWIEYPDIEPLLRDHVEPNEGRIKYTLPAIKLPDGTYIMDSVKIAHHLNAAYPSPPLPVDTPMLSQVTDLVVKCTGPIWSILLNAVPKRLLGEKSQPYWYRTRELWVGMPLDEFEKAKGGDDAWKAAGPPMSEATKLLNENKEGVFFNGATMEFCDVAWIGLLLWYKKVGDDIWGKFLANCGEGAEAHEKLLEATKQWWLRDNH